MRLRGVYKKRVMAVAYMRNERRIPVARRSLRDENVCDIGQVAVCMNVCFG